MLLNSETFYSKRTCLTDSEANNGNSDPVYFLFYHNILYTGNNYFIFSLTNSVLFSPAFLPPHILHQQFSYLSLPLRRQPARRASFHVK